MWLQFCRRNAESTKPLVPKPVINQLRNLEQELTLQTDALDYFINETEIVSQVEIGKMTYLLSQAKSKNEMSKSAVNELMHASLSKII